VVRVEYPAQEVPTDVGERANRELAFDGPAGTSEKVVKANFGEFTFYEVR